VPDRLSVHRVFGTAFAIYARNARIVLPVAIVAAFIPAALEIFVVHQLSDAVASILTSVIDNLATVFFAGAAEELVHRWEQGQRRIPLRGVLANVPRVIVPLFFVALLQGLLVAVGLLLLIVPGFIALTYAAVVGPATVAERPGVFRVFRRSFQLVRGNAWRVLLVMLSVEVLAAIVGGIVALLAPVFGEHAGEPISLAIGETITLPVEVLAVAVMYWRLREIEQRAAG
jgi:hypothetical protein